MTVGAIKKILQEYEIPDETIIINDSRRESGYTHTFGVYYNKICGVLVFTQGNRFDKFRGYDGDAWKKLSTERTLIQEQRTVRGIGLEPIPIINNIPWQPY